MQRSGGDFKSVGNDLKDTSLSLGIFGSATARNMKIIAETAAMMRKVVRQPTMRPIARPSGRPTIIATDEPVIIRLNANERLPSGATRTASGVTMDQNMACAHATPTLDNISM